METNPQEEPKYADVKLGDLFLMYRGRGAWISKVISAHSNQFTLRSLTALNNNIDKSYWKHDGQGVSEVGSEWIERPATEEDVRAFYKHVADKTFELAEAEHLVRQMNQRVDDIITPLRRGALGQNVSAQFHPRANDKSCYSIPFFALTEDQAREIVRLLTLTVVVTT